MNDDVKFQNNRSIPRKLLDRELNKLHLKGLTLDIESKKAVIFTYM